MDVERHIRLFDLIAPVYGWFFPYQIRIYRRILSAHPSFFISSTHTILDIGCGTGALACVLSEHGHQVTGIDGSQQMVAVAKRLNRHNTSKFCFLNILDSSSQILNDSSLQDQDSQDRACESPILSQSYDTVVASYVLHGLQQSERLKLYAAMKGLARKNVIIMDYNQRRGFLTSFVEWLEQGDYFNFIRSAPDEMRQVFPDVQVIQTGRQAAWYICNCH